MQFGLTIPLMKHVNMKNLSYGESEDLFFCWELHKISLHGRNSLIIVNANNRYVIALRGMKVRDWKNLNEVAQQGIKEGLRTAGFSQKEIGEYFNKAGEVRFTKTHGRKPVAGLNKAIEILQFIPMEMNDECFYQEEASAFTNHDICSPAGFEKYGHPVDFLRQDMERILT